METAPRSRDYFINICVVNTRFLIFQIRIRYDINIKLSLIRANKIFKYQYLRQLLYFGEAKF